MNDTHIDNDPDYFEIRNVSISIDDDAWHALPELQSWLDKAIQGEELSILLTNDDHIQQLNRDFRDKDKPTNVLSFPNDEGDYLGDIAISFQTIEKEAIEQNKDIYHHFTHMVIHGILHLKGYDHETDIDAEEMEAIEMKILADME